MKKDRILFAICIFELLVLIYLLLKALIGGASSLSFKGEVFFDNIKEYDTINEDGDSVVFEALPKEQQADLEHGVNIYSSQFALRSGAYIVTAEYESDGGVVNGYMLPSNGYIGITSRLKESTAKYENLVLDDLHHQVSGRLYIPAFSSVNDLQLFVHYDGPGILKVKNVTIEEKKVYRFMQIIGFLLCFAVFDCLYYFIFSKAYIGSRFDFVSKGRSRTVLIAVAVIVFSSLPLFMGYLFKGHDILFHLNRIESIAAAMRYHRLPVRIQTDLLQGFGYSVPLYYCDLFLYPAAFLYGYCMLPLRLCYQIYIFAINVLTAYTSYRCFKAIFKDQDLAAFGMVLYTLSIYRIVDIYLRAAVGEYTAFAFLPLIAEGIFRIYTEEKIKARDWLPLAVGMGCLLQSHVISTIVTAFFILIFVIAMIRKLTIRIVFALIKAACLALALSVWFIVPMLESLILLKPVVTEISSRIQWTGIYLVQLFELLPGGYGISLAGTTGDMPLGIGGGLTAGFFLLVFYFLTRNIDKDRDNESLNARVLNMSFALAAFALWMSTVYFPRDLIARLLIGRLDFLRSLLEVMELVWRHLTIATLMLSVSITALIYAVRKDKKKAYIPVVVTIVALTILTDMSFYREFTNECPQYPYIEMDNDEKAYMDMSADFDLVWGMTRQIMDDSVMTGGTDIEVISYEKDGADRIMNCSNKGESGEAILPLFDFAHYHAYDTETGGEFETVRSSENARLAVIIPKGYRGSMRITYVPPTYWRIMEIISAFAWMLLIGYGIYRLFGKYKSENK